MNAFWSYFLPPLALGFAVGVVAGGIAFRRRASRNVAVGIGLALSIALAALWHGPLGGAERFSSEIDRSIRWALVYHEIPEVTGHLHHAPLTRTVVLSGPADDFQRSQLVGIISDLPGVSSARWSRAGSGVPLIVEGFAAGLLGFLLGLLVAYLRDIRRRYNAQWNW